MIELNSPSKLMSHLRSQIDACEQHLDAQSEVRELVLQMYNGDMREDLPADKNRSEVVSEDIRTAIKKAMPATMRTLLGNDNFVKYSAFEEKNVRFMEQATEYMNLVILPESDVEDAVHDAIFDGQVVKTGILKTAAYQTAEVKFTDFTGKTEQDLVGIRGNSDYEILDEEEDQDGYLSYTLKRIERRTEPRLEAVERGRFLITPGAKSIKEAPLTGEFDELTRSELISRGYDRNAVDSLGVYHERSEDTDRAAREGDDHAEDITVDMSHAMELCRIYDICVWLDLDDDGIAELHNYVLGEGKVSEKSRKKTGKAQLVELDHTMLEESPYHDVKVEREAHQFEGRAIAEDLVSQQRVNTVLIRETLNNLYASNNPQPAIPEDQITPDGLDAVMNPKFGKPIKLKKGAIASEAIAWQNVPFFAKDSLDMVRWMREDGEDRTQITDRAAGASPEALSTMSAAGANLLNDKGVATAAYMIRTISRGGLQSAMLALLKLHIQHCDQERQILVNDKWQTYNPSLWRGVEFKCEINIGLGTGSRERDLNVVQMIYAVQKEIISEAGFDNPFVTPGQFYNTLAMLVETTGLPSPDPYFTQPTQESVARFMQSQNQGQQAAAQLEQAKMQMQAQLEQMKNQGRIAIERAQMEADERVRTVEAAHAERIEILKANHKAQIEQDKLTVDWEKHIDKLELDYTKLNVDAIDKFTTNQVPDAPQIQTNGAVNGE